ncbi:MAG: hypothetical protein SNI70_07095 [Rikenellaceae bacterium]
MKNLILKMAVAVTMALVVTISAYAQQSDQESRVIIGTYVSVQNDKIKISGRDGNIYLLDKENIDSSVILRNESDQLYVLCSDGLKELKAGSTVVINVKGIVLVEVKEIQNI